MIVFCVFFLLFFKVLFTHIQKKFYYRKYYALSFI